MWIKENQYNLLVVQNDMAMVVFFLLFFWPNTCSSFNLYRVNIKDMSGFSIKFILRYHVTGMGKNSSKVPQNKQNYVICSVVTIAAIFSFLMQARRQSTHPPTHLCYIFCQTQTKL